MRSALAVLAMLVVGFVLVGLVEAARDAPSVDEAVDLTAGLVAVHEHDLRMNPEHGLLHHVLPALLPVAIADPILPETAAYRRGDWFDYTDDVISANDDAGTLGEVLFWFRVVPLLAGAATGVLLYAIGSRLVSRSGGLVVAGLWLTTPYIVGLSHLSSIDVSFACVLAGFVLMADRYREQPTDSRLVGLACVLGIALLVRQNAVVLAPVALALVVSVHWPRRGRAMARSVGLVAVIPIVLVWFGYRLVDRTPVDGVPHQRFDALVDAGMAAGPLERLTLAVPMPIEWQAGFGYLVVTSDQRPAYLLGDEWDGSRIWFFPASAAVKLPVTATLAVLVGAAGWTLVEPGKRRRAAAAVGAPAVVVAAFLLLQPLNLGLRLAVPVLALVFVAAAPVMCLGRRLAISAVAVLAAGQIASMVVAYPHSLAWTPPPNSNGYRVVSDSSIDFGQANDDVRRREASQPFVAASLIAPRGFDVLPGVPRVEDVNPAALVGDIAVERDRADGAQPSVVVLALGLLPSGRHRGQRAGVSVRRTARCHGPSRRARRAV